MPVRFKTFEENFGYSFDAFDNDDFNQPIVKPEEPDDRWEVTKGVSSGVDQLQAIGGGIAGMIGDVVGYDGLRDWGLDVYQSNIEESRQSQARIGSYDQIESAGDAFDYVMFGLGNALPMFVPSVVGGGIGAIAARKAAQTAVKKFVNDRVKKSVAAGMAEASAARLAGREGAKAFAKGQLGGAAVGSIGLETGSIYGEVFDETGEHRAGVALSFGAMAGLLDALPVGAALKRFSGKGRDAVVKEVLDGAGTFLGKQVLKEATTEGLQTILERTAIWWVDKNKDVFDDKGWTEITNAALLGGIAGGAFSIPAAPRGSKKLNEEAKAKRKKKSDLNNITNDINKPFEEVIGGELAMPDLDELGAELSGANDPEQEFKIDEIDNPDFFIDEIDNPEQEFRIDEIDNPEQSDPEVLEEMLEDDLAEYSKLRTWDTDIDYLDKADKDNQSRAVKLKERIIETNAELDRIKFPDSGTPIDSEAQILSQFEESRDGNLKLQEQVKSIDDLDNRRNIASNAVKVSDNPRNGLSQQFGDVSLATAIRNSGGINTEIAESNGLDAADRKSFNSDPDFIGRPLFSKNGLSPDLMREELGQWGWDAETLDPGYIVQNAIDSINDYDNVSERNIDPMAINWKVMREAVQEETGKNFTKVELHKILTDYVQGNKLTPKQQQAADFMVDSQLEVQVDLQARDFFDREGDNVHSEEYADWYKQEHKNTYDLITRVAQYNPITANEIMSNWEQGKTTDAQVARFLNDFLEEYKTEIEKIDNEAKSNSEAIQTDSRQSDQGRNAPEPKDSNEESKNGNNPTTNLEGEHDAQRQKDGLSRENGGLQASSSELSQQERSTNDDQADGERHSKQSLQDADARNAPSVVDFPKGSNHDPITEHSDIARSILSKAGELVDNSRYSESKNDSSFIASVSAALDEEAGNPIPDVPTVGQLVSHLNKISKRALGNKKPTMAVKPISKEQSIKNKKDAELFKENRLKKYKSEGSNVGILDKLPIANDGMQADLDYAVENNLISKDQIKTLLEETNRRRKELFDAGVFDQRMTGEQIRSGISHSPMVIEKYLSDLRKRHLKSRGNANYRANRLFDFEAEFFGTTKKEFTDAMSSEELSEVQSQFISDINKIPTYHQFIKGLTGSPALSRSILVDLFGIAGNSTISEIRTGVETALKTGKPLPSGQLNDAINAKFAELGRFSQLDIDNIPRENDLFSHSKEEIETLAEETNTDPSEAQIEANNYKKGRVKIHGLNIAIENPKGSTRSGTDPNGKKWSNTMKHHYGDISRTEGADGDAVDVFIGDNPESEKVFVIDQVKANGHFDEVKVMLGFNNQTQAVLGYKSNYSKGWKVGKVTAMDIGEFKEWLKKGDTTKKIADSELLTQQTEKDLQDKQQKIDDVAKGQKNLFDGKSNETTTKQHIRRKNYSWDRVKLSENYTVEELGEWITELQDDPDNKVNNPAKFAPMFDKSTMRKIDNLGWAVTYLLKEAKEGKTKSSNITVKKKTTTVSKVINDLNKKNGKSLSDGDKLPIEKFNPSNYIEEPNSKGMKDGSYTFDFHNAVMDAAAEGKIDVEEFKKAYQVLINNEEEITTRLGTYTKAVLSRMSPIFDPMSRKKGELVRSVFTGMRSQYPNIKVDGDELPYFTIRKSNEEQQKTVESLTNKDLEKWARLSEKDIEKKIQEVNDRKKALSNPETLKEFSTYIRSKGEASLSAEQLSSYDQLVSEGTKEIRKQSIARSSVVTAVSGETEYEIIDTKHTKKGIDLFVVKLTGERLEKERYYELRSKAKQLGGYYSSYARDGAIPGFQFTSNENREKFINVLGGKDESNLEIKEDRYAHKKDKRVRKLLEMADKLESDGDESLNQERQTNTSKRAREAAGATQSAIDKVNFARTMRAIAQATEDGTVSILSNLSTQIQLRELKSIYNRLKYGLSKEDKVKYLNMDSMSNYTWKDNITVNQKVKFASFQDPDMYVSTLRDLSRDMSGVKGFMQASKMIDTRIKNKGERDTVNLSHSSWSKIVAKVKEFAKKDKYGASQRVKEKFLSKDRLEKMGITNTPMLREAMREMARVENYEKAEVDPLKAKELELVGRKDLGIDFFPTPDGLAKRVIEEANIESGMTVLEPSAGKGDLADAAAAVGANVDTVELSATLREFLDAKDHNVIGNDFNDLEVSEKYDRIIMNPPFSNGLDGDHVQLAYKHLKVGGRIVAITGRGVHFRKDKKSVAFREWLDDVGASVEELPEGSFKSSFRQTGVSTNLVIIDKSDPLYRSGEQVKSELTRKDVELFAKRVGSAFSGSPVTVVQSENDLPLEVQARIEHDGNTGRVKGLFYNGQIFIVGENHKTIADMQRTALHETVGHYGLKQWLGSEHAGFIKKVYASMSDSAKLKTARDNGLEKDSTDYDYETVMAEEYIAKMAEKGQNPTVIERIIAWFKDAMSKLFPNIKVSDGDIRTALAKTRKMLINRAKPLDQVTLKRSVTRNGEKITLTGRADNVLRIAIKKLETANNLLKCVNQ